MSEKIVTNPTSWEREAIRAAICFLTTNRSFDDICGMFATADKTDIRFAINAIQTYNSATGKG
jgi:hypothetical protein